MHRIAEQHDFYLDEAEGDIDLRSLAKNSGSSIVAVSVSEKDNQLKHCSSASKNQFSLFQSSVKNSGDLNSSLKSSIKNLT